MADWAKVLDERPIVVALAGPNGAGKSTFAMRASQGGHDIPDEKLAARFPRVLDNLVRAAQQLPHVIVFDNSHLRSPYRRVAQFEHGELKTASALMPAWLAAVFDADE